MDSVVASASKAESKPVGAGFARLGKRQPSEKKIFYVFRFRVIASWWARTNESLILRFLCCSCIHRRAGARTWSRLRSSLRTHLCGPGNRSQKSQPDLPILQCGSRCELTSLSLLLTDGLTKLPRCRATMIKLYASHESCQKNGSSGQTRSQRAEWLWPRREFGRWTGRGHQRLDGAKRINFDGQAFFFQQSQPKAVWSQSSEKLAFLTIVSSTIAS